MGQLIEVIMASCPSENIADASGKSIGAGRRVQCQSGTKPEILANICELLCFCVLHHPYRIKYFFIALQLSKITFANYQENFIFYNIKKKENFGHVSLCAVNRCNFLLNNVIEKILLLTQRRERYLVVGAVRFVRTILARHVSFNVHVDTVFSYGLWGKFNLG